MARVPLIKSILFLRDLKVQLQGAKRS